MAQTSPTQQSPIAHAAVRYLARGWSVLPLRCGDKRPLIRWDTLQQARTDAATLARWFAHWPDANIGVVTGEISNLVVLDVDPNHGATTRLRNWNGGSKSCPTPWKRRPVAAAGIFISRIRAASSPIAPGLSRASTCAATAVTSSRHRRYIPAGSFMPGRAGILPMKLQ